MARLIHLRRGKLKKYSQKYASLGTTLAYSDKPVRVFTLGAGGAADVLAHVIQPA